MTIETLVQENTEPQAITHETLEELRLKGDSEGINKAIEQITRKIEGEPAPEQTVAKSQNQDETEAAKKNEDAGNEDEHKVPAKKFETFVKGQKIEYDDDDGWLQYGSPGRVKKALIHKEEEIKRQREIQKKTREDVEAAVRRQLELEAKLKEYETNFRKQPQQPTQHEQRVEQKPVANVDRPSPPVEPDLPDSNLDWDDSHHAANKKYKAEKAAYENKRDEYYESLLQQRPQQSDNKELQELRERLNKTEQVARDLADKNKKESAEQERRRAENENKEYWVSLDKFRSDHKDYGDPETKDILSIHSGILGWMGNLTSHFGVQKPYTPFDPTNKDWIDYKVEEADLVNRFLSDDPDIVRQVESDKTLVPPEGYKEYYDLLNLIQFKNKMVSDGELKENASLHTAWVLKADKDGTLNEGIQNIQKNAIKDASKNVIDVLTDNFANNATRLPNDDSKGNAVLSIDEERKILSEVSLSELRKDPKLMKMHSDILKKYS
jgi:hypothetical protein